MIVEHSANTLSNHVRKRKQQSIIPAPPEDGTDGFETNGEVEPGRPILDIEHIETELVFEREIGPSGNLREPGNARLDREETAMVFLIILP